MTPSRRDILTGGAGLVLASGCAAAQAPASKLDLWNNASGPHLRGAVFSHRRIVPSLDNDFLGPGAVGSPTSDGAIASLRAAGANLALLSHPGIFTEQAPWRLDPPVLEHLDDMVTRCEAAGLFTVIAFRSGPGRSEFSIQRDSAGDWFPAELVNERVWFDVEAQDAWAEMWRETAQRFAARSGVAGFLLMVEPNANQAALPPGGEIWDATELGTRTAGTPGDWPALAARLCRTIRSVDADIPILVSPDGYANALFAGLLDLDVVPGCVLAIHDYHPRAFTHAWGPMSAASFSPADAIVSPPDYPRWMLGEYGARRWAVGAEDYVRQRLAGLERSGANSAYFRWDSGWRRYEAQENGWNPVYGTDPDASRPASDTPIVDALTSAWSRNARRP